MPGRGASNAIGEIPIMGLLAAEVGVLPRLVKRNIRSVYASSRSPALKLDLNRPSLQNVGSSGVPTTSPDPSLHPLSTSRPTSHLYPSSKIANMSFSGPVGSLPLPGFIQNRLFPSTPRNKALSIDNINPHVKEAKYAVRGELAIKSEQYRAQLAKGEGKNLPFDSVISANIGNPQQLDQQPITFFRQVASLVENPLLLENEDALEKSFGYKKDAIERAKKLLKDVKSVGAYSQSQGAPGIRKSVAEFIERRDGHPADPDNIYLCGGASAGVNALMNVLCANEQSGVLVPIPQYPLYTATLSLLNAHCVPYYLKEEEQWSTDVSDMRKALKDAQKKGIDVRAVVVINPGNPTGGSLGAEHIESVLEMAAEEKLVVLADEVYQTNVFEGEFRSFKKSLRELQKSEKNKDGKFNDIELASLHSISKGMVGECGHRGGYYEMVGFDPEVSSMHLEMRRLCANWRRSLHKSTSSSASCSARLLSASALSRSWSTRRSQASHRTSSTVRNTIASSTT